MIATPVTISVKAGPVPDRVSIEPMEPGQYGLAVTFDGPSRAQRAETHERELIEQRVPYSFHQEPDGGWTLRFGPLSAHDLHCRLESFVH